MFNEINYIIHTRSYKKTFANYLQLTAIIGSIIMAIGILIALSLNVEELKVKIISSTISMFMIVFIVQLIIQWNNHFRFYSVSLNLTAEQNLKILIKLAKRFNLKIVENNIHKGLLVFKGRISPFSLGNYLTIVYQENNMLINSRQYVDYFPWPKYQKDQQIFIESYRKEADNIV